MTNLKSTGQIAALVLTPEPRVADLVRRGKISPPPQVIAGRRLWTRDQARQAAERLDRLQPDVEAAIDAAFGPETVP